MEFLLLLENRLLLLFLGFTVIAFIWILRLLVEQTHFGSLHNIVGELLEKAFRCARRQFRRYASC